ncbi:hypothetical protein ID0084_11250 [Helicobacter pylori]
MIGVGRIDYSNVAVISGRRAYNLAIMQAENTDLVYALVLKTSHITANPRNNPFINPRNNPRHIVKPLDSISPILKSVGLTEFNSKEK